MDMDKNAIRKGPLLYEATLYEHCAEPKVLIGVTPAGTRAMELLEEKERDGYLDTPDQREFVLLLHGDII